jgi:hypothetical protein
VFVGHNVSSLTNVHVTQALAIALLWKQRFSDSRINSVTQFGWNLKDLIPVDIVTLFMELSSTVRHRCNLSQRHIMQHPRRGTRTDASNDPRIRESPDG